MDRPITVLFVCTHNSARSQMAEAYLERLGEGRFKAESAGTEPTIINPLVIRVMAEEGFDLSSKGTQSVFDLFKAGRFYDYVVTVCADADTKCPIFPGLTHRMHLPFPDPADLTGDEQEKLLKVREIRAGIKAMVEEFIAWVDSGRTTPLVGAWGPVGGGTASLAP